MEFAPDDNWCLSRVFLESPSLLQRFIELEFLASAPDCQSTASLSHQSQNLLAICGMDAGLWLLRRYDGDPGAEPLSVPIETDPLVLDSLRGPAANALPISMAHISYTAATVHIRYRAFMMAIRE